jgi:hypothetical protein
MSSRVAVFHPQAPVFSRPTPRPTHYQLTEVQRLRARRREVDEMYPFLTRALDVILRGEVTKTKMEEFAERIAKAKGVRVDRLSRRTKEGLICWLCEWAPELAFGMSNRPIPPPESPNPPKEEPPLFDWSRIRSDRALLKEEEEVLLRAMEF